MRFNHHRQALHIRNIQITLYCIFVLQYTKYIFNSICIHLWTFVHVIIGVPFFIESHGMFGLGAVECVPLLFVLTTELHGCGEHHSIYAMITI